jgi:superfamily II DNA/RNA helicase
MSFSTLGLSPTLLRALADQGFDTPTPVQAQAIGLVLGGRDLLVSAETGSGKTLSFCLPLLQALAENQVPAAGRQKRVRALILVPTRELAVQIGEVARQLARHEAQAVKVTVVFGGVSINPQMMGLRGGADIVVATPGRLLDLIDHNALSLSAVQTLVLDEADRLLDLGFEQELQRILALLPARRQNLFFSATLPPSVTALAAGLLQSPARVDVAPVVLDIAAIAQQVIEVDAPRRTQLLRHLIAQRGWSRVLVFVATKHAAEMVADKLRKAGLTAEPFHGELSQGKRTQVLLDFKNSDVQVVVATDVAARGLDVSQLPVVVNYDLPRSAVDHVHRIGRTGRAGESGLAVSFVSAGSQAHWRLIEKRQGLSVAREQVPGFEPTEVAPALASSQTRSATGESTGGVKGKRPSKKDKLRAAAALTDLGLNS